MKSMSEIVEIRFRDQQQYETNKGFIKDIIKRQHGLTKWDGLRQIWWDGQNEDKQVKRIVEDEKTIGLEIRGNRELTERLIKYLKQIGATIDIKQTSTNQEIEKETIGETNRFQTYMERLIEKGETTKEQAEQYTKKWGSLTKEKAYQKRGIEY